MAREGGVGDVSSASHWFLLGLGGETVTVPIQRCKGKDRSRRGRTKWKNWSESEVRQTLALGTPADSRVLPSFSTMRWSGVIGQRVGCENVGDGHDVEERRSRLAPLVIERWTARWSAEFPA